MTQISLPTKSTSRRVAPLVASADFRHRLTAVISGSLANLIAWYAFYLYPVFSLYLAKAFFPVGGARLLDVAGIFAVGFVMRPIGSWLLGSYADRRGRSKALVMSVMLMCAGCLIIGICPTYAQVGELAPTALLAAALLQGASLGGSYGSSAAFLSEAATSNLRGFYSSFTFVTIILGQLLATVTLLMLEQVLLTPEQLQAWGWRIPFLIGAALAVFGFMLQRGMKETAPSKNASQIAHESPPGKAQRSQSHAVADEVQAGSRACDRSDHRRNARILHLHGLHAGGACCDGRAAPGASHSGVVRRAVDIHAAAAVIRLGVRRHRPPPGAVVVRRVRCIVHRAQS